jgi:hypothetical protein
MFVMYPNERDDNVTISPRIGSKNAEPTFSSKINLDILPGTTVNDSMLILKAVCHNCRDFFNVKATQQPMMYAFGHGTRLNSNSRSADLKRHIRYGHFEMDMVAATGAGGVPEKSSAINGVKMLGGMVRDHDRANLAHAIIGCLALFVIWPLNVLITGFFKNIRIHIGVSVVIMMFLVVAYALGISTSAQFNRVSLTSPSLKLLTDCCNSPKITRPHIRSSRLLLLRQSYSSASFRYPTSRVFTPTFRASIPLLYQHPSSSLSSPAVWVFISPLKRAQSSSAIPPLHSWCSSSTPSYNPASGDAAPHTLEQTERDLDRKMIRWSC